MACVSVAEQRLALLFVSRVLLEFFKSDIRVRSRVFITPAVLLNCALYYCAVVLRLCALAIRWVR